MISCKSNHRRARERVCEVALCASSERGKLCGPEEENRKHKQLEDKEEEEEERAGLQSDGAHLLHWAAG
jgi:hypothetical protein